MKTIAWNRDFTSDWVQSVTSLYLPKEGVFDYDGYLFHHAELLKLTDEHIQRLREYGIPFQLRSHFTPEEDDRIRKNWRRFSKLHGYCYEDLLIYIGCYHHPSLDRAADRRQYKKMAALGLWPALCRKLEHRSAQQVYNRIRLIFDPNYVGKATLITESELLRVDELLDQNRPAQEIADELKIPLIRLAAAHSHRNRAIRLRGLDPVEVANNPDLLRMTTIPKKNYRRLFTVVSKQLGRTELWFRDNLIENPKKIEKETRKINFVLLLGGDLSFRHTNEKCLKDSWKAMMVELRETYLKFMNELEDNVEVSWENALEEVMPAVVHSLERYINYLSCLRKATEKTARVLNKKVVKMGKLKRRLVAVNLLNLSEMDDYSLDNCPYYMRFSTLIRRRQRSVLAYLRFDLTAREKISILMRCYEIMSERGMGDRDSNRFENIPIDRTVYIEGTIDYLRFLDPSWAPPVAFQNYIRNPELIKLYNKHSDNSELIDLGRDKKRLRALIFDDPSCSMEPEKVVYAVDDLATRAKESVASSSNLQPWESSDEDEHESQTSEQHVDQREKMHEAEKVNKKRKKKKTLEQETGYPEEEEVAVETRKLKKKRRAAKGEPDFSGKIRPEGDEGSLLDETMPPLRVDEEDTITEAYRESRRKSKRKKKKHQLDVDDVDGGETKKRKRTISTSSPIQNDEEKSRRHKDKRLSQDSNSSFVLPLDETVLAGHGMRPMIDEEEEEEDEMGSEEHDPFKHLRVSATPRRSPPSKGHRVRPVIDEEEEEEEEMGSEEHDPFKHLRVSAIPKRSPPNRSREPSTSQMTTSQSFTDSMDWMQMLG